jgi:glycosyltransferase involved in cell wall biosynthesis
MSLRILQLSASLGAERGGPIQVIKEMSTALAARGHEVHLHATDAGPRGTRLPLDARPSLRGVEVTLHRADLLRPPYLSTGLLAAVARLAPRFDIVHVHGCFNAPMSGAMATLRLLQRLKRPVPYILRPCGMLDRYSLTQHALRKRLWLATLERSNVERAAFVQCSTPHEEREVRLAVRDARTVVLPQGVAPPSPPGERPHPRPYLLFLSRVAKKKGLPLLLEAFAALLSRPSPLSEALDLVIAGPDEDGHRADIERLHLELSQKTPSLRSRVHFMGPVSGAMKSAWFAHAEAFVLPSDDENFGVVVIEAAHLGTPVLVSDAVGLGDAVSAHHAGLVLPRTPEAWVSGMAQVLAEGRGAYAEGTSSLAAAFHWDHLAERLEQLYGLAMAQR